MEEIRLNKYLSQMGICSRREADRLIESGNVLVDGQKAFMGMKIRENQRVTCNGRWVGQTDPEHTSGAARPKAVLLAVNKPKGVVCTTSDKDRALNIVQMVDYPVRVYPVGRLDKDSEGLIFLTNQGELVNKIMRGAAGHEKEYVVLIDRPVTHDFAKKMEAGIYLKELDVTTRPCRVFLSGEREFHIILTQGLNRQIRRMCETLGCHVKNLKRIRIMNVTLGSLKAGAFRKVTPKEQEVLYRLLEGPAGKGEASWKKNLEE